MLCAFVSLPPEAASEWEAACKSFPPEVKQDGPRELTPAAVATTAFQALSPSLAKLTFAAGPDGVDTAGPTSSSNSTEFRRFGLELFKHVLCGAVSPINAVRLLADALSTSPAASPAAASILADIAWLTGMEIEESGGLSGEPTADWKKSSEFGRFRALIGGLSSAGVVSDTLFRERLELDLLEACGLLKSATNFKKSVTRANTKLKYAQQKFNLLQEESEGYAKICGEFLRPLTPESVPVVARNMRMLIGYFRLDPNRVLDLLLEAFEMNPHNANYLALIELFPSSHLPHIIGFKFQQFTEAAAAASSAPAPAAGVATVSTQEHTSRSLLFTTACLLSAGKLTLESVGPHLSPPLDSLRDSWSIITESLRVEAKSVSVVTIGGPAPVPTDDSSTALIGSFTGYTACEAVKDVWKNNQWLGLLESLVSLRSWTLVKQLAGLLAASGMSDIAIHPPIGRALCSAVHETIAAAYPAVAPTEDAPATTSAIARKPSPYLPPSDRDDGPVPSLSATCARVRPLLSLLGVHLCNDVKLFVRLCRIVGAVLNPPKQEVVSPAVNTGVNDGDVDTGPATASTGSSEDGLSELASEQLDAFFVLKDSLAPAMSLMGPNVAVVSELWAAAKGLSWKLRYMMFAHWNLSLREHPLLALSSAKAAQATRQAMKRVAGGTDVIVAIIGRRLGRIAHANPLPVLDAIFTQLKSYDNLIPITLDALKYMTALSFDAATYVLLAHLNPVSGASKVQSDNITPSPWYSAIGALTGSLYKKYHAIEMKGLLNSFLAGLLKHSTFDLYPLQEVLVRVGDCASIAEVSDAQLQGLSGGPVLQAVSLQLAVVVSKKSCRRLRDVITDGLGTGSAVMPLYLLICSQLDYALFHDRDATDPAPLKEIGGKFDLVMATLMQYLDFLNANLSVLQLAANLPNFESLTRSYGLKPQFAFAIARPALRVSLIAAINAPKGSTEPLEPLDASIVPWDFRSESLQAQLSATLPATAWGSMTPLFYSLFWSLSLQDIHCPRDQYLKAAESMREEISSLEGRARAPADEFTPLDPRELEKKRKQCEETIKRMEEEQPKQAELVKKIREYLISVKGQMFGSVASHADTVQTLLQHCVYPRVMLSPADALFTAKFFLLLHSISTPFFSTISYIDRVLRQLTPTLLCCSRREATCLGVFLNETLTTFQRWSDSKAVYDKECVSKVGFSRQIRGEVGEAANQIAFDNFSKVYKKVQERITKIFLISLSSTEYMELINTFVVLRRLTCFPATQAAGRSVLEKVALIRDNDSRDDLKNAAKMYAGSLERLLPKLKDAGEKAPTPAPAAAPVVVLAPEKASAGERRGGGREPEKPKAREPSPAAPAPAKPPAASTPKPSAVKAEAAPSPAVIPKELLSLKAAAAPVVAKQPGETKPPPQPPSDVKPSLKRPLAEPGKAPPSQTEEKRSAAAPVRQDREGGGRDGGGGGAEVKRPRGEGEERRRESEEPSRSAGGGARSAGRGPGEERDRRPSVAEERDRRPPSHPPSSASGGDRDSRAMPPPADGRRDSDRPVIRLATHGGGSGSNVVMPSATSPAPSSSHSDGARRLKR